MSQPTYKLPRALVSSVEKTLADWRSGNKVQRLDRDSSLWTGGPNSGVFLQITCDDAADVAMPGQKYTFGVVKAAQARGDFQVLVERGRRALRVHLSGDLKSGLSKPANVFREALA